MQSLEYVCIVHILLLAAYPNHTLSANSNPRTQALAGVVEKTKSSLVIRNLYIGVESTTSSKRQHS